MRKYQETEKKSWGWGISKLKPSRENIRSYSFMFSMWDTYCVDLSLKEPGAPPCGLSCCNPHDPLLGAFDIGFNFPEHIFHTLLSLTSQVFLIILFFITTASLPRFSQGLFQVFLQHLSRSLSACTTFEFFMLIKLTSCG